MTHSPSQPAMNSAGNDGRLAILGTWSIALMSITASGSQANFEGDFVGRILYLRLSGMRVERIWVNGATAVPVKEDVRAAGRRVAPSDRLALDWLRLYVPRRGCCSVYLSTREVRRKSARTCGDGGNAGENQSRNTAVAPLQLFKASQLVRT